MIKKELIALIKDAPDDARILLFSSSRSEYYEADSVQIAEFKFESEWIVDMDAPTTVTDEIEVIDGRTFKYRTHRIPLTASKPKIRKATGGDLHHFVCVVVE